MIAVDAGARSLPGIEDGFDRVHQLLARILRELAAPLLLVDGDEGVGQLLEIVGIELGVVLDPALLLHPGQCVLEQVRLDAVDDLAVHLDQAAIAVVGEAGVARRLGQPGRRGVVETEVEDGVHHPRHRDGGAGAHRYEQRILQIAELLARLLLEANDGLVHFLVQPCRNLSLAHVRAASISRDGETAANRHPDLRHFRKTGSLAAE